MSKIIAEPVRATDLKPGDLFSPDHGPEYWWVFPNFLSVGEGVFLRTASPCPPEDADVVVYRLRTEREFDLLAICEKVLAYLVECPYFPGNMALLELLGQTIAKAKGEQS